MKSANENSFIVFGFVSIEVESLVSLRDAIDHPDVLGSGWEKLNARMTVSEAKACEPKGVKFSDDADHVIAINMKTKGIKWHGNDNFRPFKSVKYLYCGN